MTQAAIRVNFKAVEAFFIVFRATKSEDFIVPNLVELSVKKIQIKMVAKHSSVFFTSTTKLVYTGSFGIQYQNFECVGT